jgi:nicotinamide mononucleotide (NMN) deamidase PncC
MCKRRTLIERVFVGLAKGRMTWVLKLNLKGSRREIKKQAAERSLEFLYKMLIEKAGF